MTEGKQFEMLPEEYWNSLMVNSTSYRDWLKELGKDSNLGVRIITLSGKSDDYEDEFWGKISWFTDWLERKLEAYRIPQMLAIYKSETGGKWTPGKIEDFVSPIEKAPDWKKRRFGIKVIMLRDFKELPKSEFLHHRATANFIYLFAQTVELIENHKGFTSGKESEFKRLMREDPVEGPQQSVYEYLAGTAVIMLLLKSREDFEKLVDSFRPVYEFMGEVRRIIESPGAE